MYLLIDAGNTRVKWGFHDGSRWLCREDVAHDALATCDFMRFGVPERVLIAHVASDAIRSLILEQLGDTAGRAEWLAASLSRCGVTNRYAEPTRLGPDRWAAAIGAWHRVRGACVVVSAGTATTVDAIDAGGNFLGGLILPGHGLMLRALAGGTAALPLAEGDCVAFPKNTHDAIETGIRYAQSGAVERFRQEMPAHTPVVLSGGSAAALAPLIAPPRIDFPNLVLEGLLCVARDTA
ncbi:MULTISPECIES: type III pantothenate kinase [Niveibacterium]|uniref:Type III pantothenate kinase n=1 Tax=Niveibacterium microcysteis TaxID=2811415 RepID=A0ABX7M3F8_9RHOO|nr:MULTISPECIES: type III pantothenate kinase [Niveibacterium]QSI76290.1 type III pantothenate kinase [Niveibacterium microcysteis]